MGKNSSPDSKNYPPDSFMGRLKERKIIATLAAFAGSGVVIIELAHHILVNHYHFPHQIVDFCIVTLAGALIATLTWQWFRAAEKRPGNVKVEVLVVPLIILLTAVIDLKLIFAMTGITINMLPLGIVAICLGIAWVIVKSLQWAASVSEAEKKVEVLKPEEDKPISSPEWEKSIVVLPFENFSPDEGQDYFCDGMTEEIITDLSKIHSLRVISRGSAMTLKGTNRKAREIAEELNVQYVLEGSVRKAGNNLRITAQLIEAANDTHLWAEKYTGTLDEVFDIQEKVSRSIVNSLKLKLSAKEDQEMEKHPIDNIHAYECYLKANQEIYRFSKESYDRAVRLIQNGLDVVGENELLYEAMGNVHVQYVNFGVASDESYLLEAEKWIGKLMNISPNSSQGYFLNGLLYWKRAEWKEGIRLLQKSLDLDPNNPRPREYLTYILTLAGKGDVSRNLLPKLLEIDPLTPLFQCFPGWIEYMEGNFEEALGSIQKMYQMEPENLFYGLVHAHFLTRIHRIEEANSIIDSLVKSAPQTYWAQIGLFRKLALQESKQEALKLMTPELEKTIRWDEQMTWEMAANYALMGEKQEALDWLEIAVNRGFINYPFLSEYDPFLENIRGEPRFKKLMERVKHEWENFEV